MSLDKKDETKKIEFSKPLSKYDTKYVSEDDRETLKRLAHENQTETLMKSRTSRPKPAAVPGGRPPSMRTSSAPRTAPAKRKPEPEPKKKKSAFSAVYILMLLLAVGVCLTVFVTVLQRVVDNEMFGGIQPPTTPPPIMLDRPDAVTFTGMITDINVTTTPQTISFVNVNTYENSTKTIPSAMTITSRLGRVLTISDLRVGQIVDARFDANRDEMISIGENVHAWEHANRTNIHVNLEEQNILIGNQLVNFIPQTLIMHRGRPIPISDISPEDSVTIIGIRDTAWMVSLDAAHGFLNIANRERLLNGTMIIGTTQFWAINDVTEPLTLTEGVYRITIDGSNIDSFIKTITIYPSLTTTIDLSVIPLRQAYMTFIVYPEDARIFVNGELHHDNNEPALVNFGENHILVEADGFDPQERLVGVVAPSNQQLISLTRTPLPTFLEIATIPNNAEIFVNNVYVGNSPLIIEVPPGFLQVTARITGHHETTVHVNALANQTTFRPLVLTPIGETPPQTPFAPPPPPTPTPTPFAPPPPPAGSN